MHVASSYYYDVEPCLKAKVPVIWVNRNKETLDAAQKKPTAEVKTLLEAAKLLGAGSRRAGRRAARRRHRRHSRAYAHGCTLVRSGDEAFCVDSPVFPDELEILPAIAEQAGFNVVGVLATHADWDHLLGRYAFPEAPLGCAETTAARLINEPGRGAARLRDFDDELYVERPEPLSLPGGADAPGAGHSEIGERALELHPADGHTEDGMAIWVPWARPAVAGDYLSPVEIPMISRRVGERVPRDAGPARAARRAGRPRRAGPRRADRRHARGRDPARGPRLPEALLEHGAERSRCRSQRRAAQDPRRATRRRVAG